MTYLLDNNVVSYFLHARREADLMDAARRCSLAIADEVRKELRQSPRDGGRFKAWCAGGAIASRPITVGSGVDTTYQALTPPTAERGKGERASIALAAHDPSLVLVANDRNAMHAHLMSASGDDQLTLDPEAPGLDEETRRRRRALAKLQQLSVEELFQAMVRAGIYTEDGDLAPPYRDDGEPSACRPTD